MEKTIIGEIQYGQAKNWENPKLLRIVTKSDDVEHEVIF
jgi:hypothetical protein